MGPSEPSAACGSGGPGSGGTSSSSVVYPSESYPAISLERLIELMEKDRAAKERRKETRKQKLEMIEALLKKHKDEVAAAEKTGQPRPETPSILRSLPSESSQSSDSDLDGLRLAEYKRQLASKPQAVGGSSQSTSSEEFDGGYLSNAEVRSDPSSNRPTVAKVAQMTFEPGCDTPIGPSSRPVGWQPNVTAGPPRPPRSKPQDDFHIDRNRTSAVGARKQDLVQHNLSLQFAEHSPEAFQAVSSATEVVQPQASALPCQSPPKRTKRKAKTRKVFKNQLPQSESSSSFADRLAILNPFNCFDDHSKKSKSKEVQSPAAIAMVGCRARRPASDDPYDSSSSDDEPESSEASEHHRVDMPPSEDEKEIGGQKPPPQHEGGPVKIPVVPSVGSVDRQQNEADKANSPNLPARSPQGTGNKPVHVPGGPSFNSVPGPGSPITPQLAQTTIAEEKKEGVAPVALGLALLVAIPAVAIAVAVTSPILTAVATVVAVVAGIVGIWSGISWFRNSGPAFMRKLKQQAAEYQNRS